ncbi:hypothetical protein JL722_10476 [Aureococcus anophagefferens]|nr:hypothetical protein JL722_10476 [Aureococcus anophagefferens]
MLDDVADDGETDIPELRVGGASEPVLRAVLDYAYGGVVRLTEENVEPLLELASRLRMTALVEECCSFVAQRTRPCRACRVLAVADRHKCRLLRRDVLLCVLRHFDEAAGLAVDPAVAVVAAGGRATKKTMAEGSRAACGAGDRAEAAAGFGDLPLHLLEEVLADDRLTRATSRSSRAAVAWLDAPGREAQREAHADAVLRHVRFPLIDPEFLADCVEPHARMQSPAGTKLVHDAYRNLCLPPERRKVAPAPRRATCPAPRPTGRRRVAVAERAGGAGPPVDSGNPFLTDDSEVVVGGGLADV